MKRQSIFVILLLLQVLLISICTGCGSAEPAAESPVAISEKDVAVAEEAVPEEAAMDIEIPEEEILATQKATGSLEYVEDMVGIFEGLEDNHTAIFSFDGAEAVFYFEDPAVQAVLYEAVLGSPYTLSWHLEESLGLNVITEISE